MTNEEIKRTLETIHKLLTDNKVNAVAEAQAIQSLPSKEKDRDDDVRAAELAGYVCGLQLGVDLIHALIKEI